MTDNFATLVQKRDELERLISSFERKIAILSDDLSHMRSVLAFYEKGIVPADLLPHMDLDRVFVRRELMDLCISVLEAADGLDSREIAEEVIFVKGLDREDPVLHEKMTAKVAYVMRKAWERDLVVKNGYRNGGHVWWLRAT